MKSGATSASRKDNDGIDWSYLCNDMLFEIISRLSLDLDDVKSFRRVCKSWRLIKPPSQLPRINFSACAQSQWLICIEGFHGTRAKFFHPLYKYPYVKSVPELRGAAIRFSNNGWLLITKGTHSVFFLNPFTNDVIYLPDYHGDIEFTFMAFTSSPTSDDCMVIGFQDFAGDRYSISTIVHGDKGWKVKKGTGDLQIGLDVDIDFDELGVDERLHIKHSGSSPVLHGDKLYILGIDGNLGALCHKNRNNVSWSVYENPEVPSDLCYQNFLVKCDGALFSVFLGDMGDSIEIFKMNDTTMAWETVESLGDHMLFLGLKACFSRKKDIEGMQGKIYFPFIHENWVVFYSLDKERYGTFGNSYLSKDLYGIGEPLLCSWIEPNFNACSDQELKWFVPD